MVLSKKQRQLEFLKSELKEGRISRREFKQLRKNAGLDPGQFGRTKRPSVAAQVLRQRQGVSTDVMQRRQANIEKGFFSIDPRVMTREQRAQEVVEQAQLRQAFPSTATIPTKQKIKIQVKRTNIKDESSISNRDINRVVSDVSTVPSNFKSSVSQSFREPSQVAKEAGRGVLSIGEDIIIKPIRGAGKFSAEMQRQFILSQGISEKEFQKRAPEFVKKVVPSTEKQITGFNDEDFQSLLFVSALSGAGGRIAKGVTTGITALEGIEFVTNPTPEQLGRFGTLLILPKVTEKITEVPQRFREFRAGQKFKALEKSVMLKDVPFTLKEQTKGAQRTLFGKSLSDTFVKETIKDLNKLKIGFGIEKNPLKPVSENILSTGQTRLAQDKIVSVNLITGKASSVNVEKGQPFVFRERIGKFTEFVPGQEVLITKPVTQRRISPEIEFRDLSRQLRLVEEKPTSKAFKLLPEEPKISKDIVPEIKSGKGVETISLNRARLQEAFSAKGFQETLLEPSVKPKEPILKEIRKIGFRLNISPLPKTRDILTERTVSKIKVVPLLDIPQITEPRISQRLKLIPQIKPVSGIKPVSDIAFEPITDVDISFVPELDIPLEFKKSFRPRPDPPDIPDPVLVPPSILLLKKKKPKQTKGKAQRKLGSRGFAITPSLVSIALELPSPKFKKDFLFTGFERR